MVLISISDRFDFHVPVPIVQKKKGPFQASQHPGTENLSRNLQSGIVLVPANTQRQKLIPTQHSGLVSFHSNDSQVFLEINKLTNTKCCFGVFSSQHI